MFRKNSLLILAAIGFATPVLAQTPNANQAAVDTLTKDVATAVFLNQPGTKAAEILDQLSMCGDGCDAVSVIKQVGGWDAVGVKIEEMGRLENTAKFQAMSPGDANAAIRRELARFYGRYKSDKNYGVPLNQTVQAQMLAKLDGMLPPNPAPQATPAVTGQPAGAGEQVGMTDESANINPTAIQISQLQRAVKDERENRIWMMILSAIAGLLVGAGVVYFMLYRALKNEVEDLTKKNQELRQDLEAARRPKPANEARQPQMANRPRPETYVAPRPEPARPVPPVEPTPPVADPTPAVPGIRSGTPVAGVSVQTEPVMEPVSTPEPVALPTQTQSPAPARSDIFYFPPPDPNGQFDNAQKSDMLSPESAYWFSKNAETPDVASFRFEAEPGRVARFLTYRNYMIEPACDSENSYSAQYTRIVNRRDGEAVLENGAWRVKTKALIRYE